LFLDDKGRPDVNHAADNRRRTWCLENLYWLASVEILVNASLKRLRSIIGQTLSLPKLPPV
jgi:hypothetical protein